MDDIFVLFKSAEHLPNFCDYFNTCHQNMSLSFEQEKDGKLSFLEVEVSRQEGHFVTTAYETLCLGNLLLVVFTRILKVFCQQYTNLV